MKSWKRKEKIKEEIEGKKNEIQHLSLQQADFINQLTNANEETMNLRSENERLQNNLNTEKQINEKMMKSQANMNQLNEQSHHKQKGKTGIGYTKEGESSKQGVQKNQRPTCNHCGKIGHTSKKCWSNRKAKCNGKCYSCRSMVIEKGNVKRNQDLKENVTNSRNMDTSHQNTKPRY